MTAAAWVPIITGLLAAVALVWQTRINGATTTRTSLDDRAQDTLELALESQDKQIAQLTTRVERQATEIVSLSKRAEHLEREVESCEIGRKADRAAFAAEIAAVRAEMAARHQTD